MFPDLVYKFHTMIDIFGK